MAAASNAFGMDLWRRLAHRERDLAVSPASGWLALAMTHAGARGDTAAEMARVMRMPERPEQAHADAGALLQSWNLRGGGEITLRVVNRLFGERSYRFEDAYLALTRERWRAPLEPTNFRTGFEAARGRINSWVAGETQDRIRDLLPPHSLDSNTRLVLVNAVYFLGKWLTPFEHLATHDAPFYTAAGRGRDVPTMHETAIFRHAQVDDVQLLEMPYRGGDFAMTIVLPRETQGLSAVEAHLDAPTIDRWMAALEAERIAVSLPRFTIDSPVIALKVELEALGMHLAVDRLRADFTGIARPLSPADRLFIGEVFHKTFVKVDEEGTEAAAATAVVMPRGGGIPVAAPEFRADHPFLFLLRHTPTGVILFLGRVADPSAG